MHDILSAVEALPGSERVLLEVVRNARERRGPHPARTRRILRRHPELSKLAGHAPVTGLWMLGYGMLQLGLAAWLGDGPWWLVLLAAYSVGAVLALGIWVLVHETFHDLVMRRRAGNQLAGILAALPLTVPSVPIVRTCHVMHHRHQGDARLDGDIPSGWEARLVDNSPLRKAVWLGMGALVQSSRILRMKGIRLFDRWFVLAFVLQMTFNCLVVWGLGWPALAYLLLSNIFSLGLHPLGARWIQEHFILHPEQETYSYYGPMNRLCFNAGFHNEHHDLVRVPWMRLPQIRQAAPELYADLHSYRSWTALLFRFLFDRNLTLECRAIRDGRANPATAKLASQTASQK